MTDDPTADDYVVYNANGEICFSFKAGELPPEGDDE